MTKKTLLARRIVLGGGFAAATGYLVLQGFPVSAQTSDAGTSDTEIPDMVLGDADAPIEMIMYSSFTCGHCARFHTQVYPLLKANYFETGKVRFVFREVFSNRLGLWAAMIARCGGPERFFGLAELLFQRQDEWAGIEDGLSQINALFDIGRLAGLDEETMNACARDRALAEALVANYQKAAGADNISEPPVFIINGNKTGSMPYEEFETVLNDLLDG